MEVTSRWFGGYVEFSKGNTSELELYDTAQEVIDYAKKHYGQYPGTRLILRECVEKTEMLCLLPNKKGKK